MKRIVAMLGVFVVCTTYFAACDGCSTKPDTAVGSDAKLPATDPSCLPSNREGKYVVKVCFSNTGRTDTYTNPSSGTINSLPGDAKMHGVQHYKDKPSCENSTIEPTTVQQEWDGEYCPVPDAACDGNKTA